MNVEGFQIEWVEEIPTAEIGSEEIITMDSESEGIVEEAEEYLVGEEIISADMHAIPNSLDQIAAENLIYMAQDGQVQSMGDLIEEQVEQTDNANYNEEQYFECQVTEEVITDDWVQQQGEERVEIPVDQLCGSADSQIIAEIEVPLPTDQDEYTALRPYPCDFCSRRFRKKVSLMNHMIAHQNDRPHVCNLCGARYIRRSDLLNHLKVHAHVPENSFDDIDESFLNEPRPTRSRAYYEEKEEDVTERTRAKPSVGRVKRKVKIEDPFSELEPQMQQQVVQYPITDPRKPFVCQQCGIGFAREKALLSHSRIHGGDSPYECTACNEMFWDANMLQDHQRTHHFEASNSEYEPEIDEETESDNDSKYGEFYCNVCGMSFHRQDLLKRHSKTHVKKELYESDLRHCCNVCGDTFEEALDLLAHAEVHARFQPFKCTLCGETFLEETTIKKHLSNVHSSEMNANSCKLCGKLCRDGRSLMKHAWDHSREKNHSCSKCGKTFHNKARLKRHMVSHRNKSVRCDVCNEEFPDGRSLMNHRHSHTNSSGRLFPCNECGKTFGSRSSQQIHVRIHTGERPYGCRYCYKAFADGGTLRKHERIHTGEKPYACSVCPRAFNQRVVLREHIRSHHSAPDTKRGTALTPYYCNVCSDLFSQSIDLIQHLIQHSDMNTAMQRQPITGPRKYKRRRKLKPHELERLHTDKANNTDVENSDLDMRNVNNVLVFAKSKRSRFDTTASSSSNALLIPQQSSQNRKCTAGSDKVVSWQQKLLTTANEDAYSVLQNLENELQNIEPLVGSNSTVTTVGSAVSTKSRSTARRRITKQETEKPSRPKMIHTQKTRVAIEDGKRKTKTMITRTEPTEIGEQDFQQFERPKSERHTDYDLLISAPITVSHSSHHDIKQEEPARSDLFDAQLLLEAASMRRELEKYNPDIVNDLEEILRSPVKQKPISSPLPILSNRHDSLDDQSTELKEGSGPDEEVRRSTRVRRSAQNKKYLEFETSRKPASFRHLSSSKTKQKKQEKITIKVENFDTPSEDEQPEIVSPEAATKKEHYFQCEMCCATFSDRRQLLMHVNIHI